jgi:large subunit ribosomal protein L10
LPGIARQRLFLFGVDVGISQVKAKEPFLKGGENPLAITKERKNELIDQYGEWVKKSQVQVVMSYAGLSMKDIDSLRGKLREVGGEFHVVKNTLVKLAFQQAGMPLPEKYFEESTAIAFAFEDVPAFAKTLSEFLKPLEFIKVKGGYLDKKPISSAGVKALADMPPLPVMQAQLLGVLLAPASRLVRTLAEPARGLAAVIKAHAGPEAAAQAAG